MKFTFWGGGGGGGGRRCQIKELLSTAHHLKQHHDLCLRAKPLLRSFPEATGPCVCQQHYFM